MNFTHAMTSVTKIALMAAIWQFLCRAVTCPFQNLGDLYQDHFDQGWLHSGWDQSDKGNIQQVLSRALFDIYESDPQQERYNQCGDQGNFKVWIAESATSTKESLRIHMEYVQNPNFYICEKWGTRTKTLEALSFHTEKRHSFDSFDSANNPFKRRCISLFESMDKISFFSTSIWIILAIFLGLAIHFESR